MKVLLIVHGVVQGVGYRNFVRNAAVRHNIKGSVRNVSDGSVEIFAVGDERALGEFEKEIGMSTDYGHQVMHLERFQEGSGRLPEEEDEHAGFVIKRDKRL